MAPQLGDGFERVAGVEQEGDQFQVQDLGDGLGFDKPLDGLELLRVGSGPIRRESLGVQGSQNDKKLGTSRLLQGWSKRVTSFRCRISATDLASTSRCTG